MDDDERQTDYIPCSTEAAAAASAACLPTSPIDDDEQRLREAVGHRKCTTYTRGVGEVEERMLFLKVLLFRQENGK